MFYYTYSWIQLRLVLALFALYLIVFAINKEWFPVFTTIKCQTVELEEDKK